MAVLSWLSLSLSIADIKKDKTEQELKNSIGSFDKSNLKHQEVNEKNPLPPTDGKARDLWWMNKGNK